LNKIDFLLYWIFWYSIGKVSFKMSFKQQLIDAIASNNNALAMAFVDTLPGVDTNDHNYIIHNCDVNRISFLATHGIKIDYKAFMMCAIRYQRLTVIKFLLENKFIDPNEQFYHYETGNSDEDDMTNQESWLHYIIYSLSNGLMNNYNNDMGDDVLNIIIMFVTFGANINVINGHGKNIIRYAINDCYEIGHPNAHEYEYTCSEIDNKSMAPIIKYLINAGFDVNSRDTYGYTILHVVLHSFAFTDQDMDLVRFLVDHGADLNALDAHQFTPLHWIIMKFNGPDNCDDYGILHYMLQNGSDPLALENGIDMATIEMIRNDAVRAIIDEYKNVPVKGVNIG